MVGETSGFGSALLYQEIQKTWGGTKLCSKDKVHYWWHFKGSLFSLNQELSHKYLSLLSMIQRVIW